MAMKKMTFTLDADTVARLEKIAELLDAAKSEVVRDAVREYSDRIRHLSERERTRMLRALDEVLPRIPARPVEEVEREIEEVREARRAGGRRRPGSGSAS